MRRRLVISTIAIVLVVLGALALPVGLIVYNAAEEQLVARLTDQANTIAAYVTEAAATDRAPNTEAIRDTLGPNDGVEIIGPDGTPIDRVRLTARSTQQVEARADDGSLVIVTTSSVPLDENFRAQLQSLLLLAVGAIAAAAGLAWVQARQLARPLERLSRRAAAIGDGDFSLGPFVRTNIPEVDAIGAALETSSKRVDTMLANERHFTADATHQLRTGIAGIAMRVEILSMHGDQGVADEALELLDQTDQLNSTIDELLAAARNRTTNERGVFDLPAVVNAHVEEWRPRYEVSRRHLGVVASNPSPPVYGTKGLAGQVIDILIDNALRHGAGAVTMLLDGPSVTVIDQGMGVSDDQVAAIFAGPVDPSARHGRGLSLARRLAQVDGATLEMVGNRPLRLRFTLPRAETADLRH